MSVCVVGCLVLVAFSSSLGVQSGISQEYETKLFDTSKVLDINVLIDDEKWQELLNNATSETYYQCDVEIDGTSFYRVGIRPKGNTSLTTIANDPNTDRYSLKLEFDQYVDGQTCFGLDKLVLNNSYADTTYMKDALILDMYQYIGADAPLYNYAKLSVNGEYFGLYLAIEAVEESFILRNYGVSNGALYKPESMAMGGGGFSMGGGGANLNYTDDNLDNYSTIWEGEVTNTKQSDHQRVVTALKNISQGIDLEKYMDVDNLLRYMAVHIFSENSDSLSGNMAHNYYLYENNGMLNLIPWDYNLALGGMNGNDATSTVNGAIDDAWNGTDFFDALLENEEYLNKYHEYMLQLSEYISGEEFEEFYTKTREQIDLLVQADPNSFYSYEEYQTGVETLYEVVKLRGESISLQVQGVIPSTDSQQRSATNLIDASHINLSNLGTMNFGGGNGGFNFINRTQNSQNESSSQQEQGRVPQGDFDPSQFGQGQMPENFDPSQFGDGQMPEGFDPSQFGDGQMPENFDPSQFGDGQMPENFDPSQFGQGQFTPNQDGNSQSNRPSKNNGGSVNNKTTLNGSTLIWYIVGGIVIVAALLFALFFKRRPRKR